MKPYLLLIKGLAECLARASCHICLEASQSCLMCTQEGMVAAKSNHLRDDARQHDGPCRHGNGRSLQRLFMCSWLALLIEARTPSAAALMLSLLPSAGHVRLLQNLCVSQVCRRGLNREEICRRRLD